MIKSLKVALGCALIYLRRWSVLYNLHIGHHQTTRGRSPFPIELYTAVCISYLATPDSMLSIADKAHLGESTVGEWVGEFVDIIIPQALAGITFVCCALNFEAVYKYCTITTQGRKKIYSNACCSLPCAAVGSEN